MATTVTWQDSIATGTTGDWTIASFLRFNNANLRLAPTGTLSLSNPMVKPTGANHDFSYEKWCRINVSSIDTSVSNLKLVSTTAYMTGTGTGGLAGCQVDYGFTTAYPTAGPAGATSAIATIPMTASLSASWEYTNTTTKTLTAPADKWRKYVVFQLDITSAVVAGEKSFGNITARYDKI